MGREWPAWGATWGSAGAAVVGVIVAIGLFPRCDELQTVAEARRDHGRMEADANREHRHIHHEMEALGIELREQRSRIESQQGIMHETQVQILEAVRQAR